MGGSALKIPVSRFSRTQGKAILESLSPDLDRMFKHWVITKSVKEKSDFGDMDIICSEPKLDLRQYIKDVLTPQEMVSNANVLSFEYSGIQVDLIVVPSEQFAWAYYYYSNNDLGNLIGRIARNLGFKFGGQGFYYEFQRDSGNFSRDILISRDIRRVLSFLGFSTFKHNFDTFEDMYKYVLTSAVVDPTMFLLENRNFEGRHRDKKRKVYMNFLTWLQDRYDMPMLAKQTFNQQVHLTRAKNNWLLFCADFRDSEDDFVVYQKRKEKFNGKMVMEVTGLQGRELGAFIKDFKNNINFPTWLNDPKTEMTSHIRKFFENYHTPPKVKLSPENNAELAVAEVLASEG
jgi:hypothetical protein